MNATPYVECSRGDECVFVADFGAVLDPAYVLARFVVRESFDTGKPALVDITEATGITIGSTPSTVTVTITAAKTLLMTAYTSAKPLAAQLRLSAVGGTRPMSVLIPFILMPGTIDV